MIRVAALPLLNQVLLDLLVPPIGACLWWLVSRGWAHSVQGTTISEKTRKRQRFGFWLALALAYIIMTSITVYGLLT
jgi:hypothetical protein